MEEVLENWSTNAMNLQQKLIKTLNLKASTIDLDEMLDGDRIFIQKVRSYFLEMKLFEKALLVSTVGKKDVVDSSIGQVGGFLDRYWLFGVEPQEIVVEKFRDIVWVICCMGAVLYPEVEHFWVLPPVDYCPEELKVWKMEKILKETDRFSTLHNRFSL